MIKIITSKKSYIWNYKQLLKNLAITIGIIGFLLLYSYVSHLDYLTAIGQ